jgi:DNA-binding NarL/FixJ family response regulator
VDLNLPDGSGLDIVRLLAATRPETCVVVCTIFDDDHHVFSALRAGAGGYLVKDQPRKQQLAMLADLVNGAPPISPGIARRMLRYFSGERPGALDDSQELTDREKDVLVFIAKGYSRPETAELMGISANTVAGYTKSIYRKLKVSTRAEAVSEAIRRGIVTEA